MIELLVTKQSIKVTQSSLMVSGTANYLAHFTFSDEWDRLTKTAVFSIQNGCSCSDGESYPVLINEENICKIPVSILKAGTKLKIGVYGVSSEKTYPTVWSNGIVIQEGAVPSGEVPPEDESVYRQILLKLIEIEEKVDKIDKPYASIERLATYLYKVSFTTLPEHIESDSITPAGCSSYLQNGKFYRNLDWDYSELASFHVIAPGFEGMAFSPGLTGTHIDDDLVGQLPYRLVDGCNDYGIRVSTHVLFNDWNWAGHGSTPMYMVPYLILSRLKTLDNLSYQLQDILGDLHATQTLLDSEYLLHFFVTDGSRAFCIAPPENSSGNYVVIDISANPKLSNFRWVPDVTVERAELQTRPTGVERWNMMPCPLSELRFTRAYEYPNRLSEFIGLRGTTKDSSDAELADIYEVARGLYLRRVRDGSTWQTMHSVVYSSSGIEELYVQENWDKNYEGHGSSEITGDLKYVHEQYIASDTWTIEHNLGKYPSVTVVDSAETIVIGDVEYLSIAKIRITFHGAFSGKAYLN